VNWTLDDLIAVVVAPLILFGFVRVLPSMHRRVPGWSPMQLAALWTLVLGVLAALVALSVTVKAILIAWIFAALATVVLTRTWIAARRSGQNS
jgi:hypothetical protein